MLFRSKKIRVILLVTGIFVSLFIFSAYNYPGATNGSIYSSLYSKNISDLETDFKALNAIIDLSDLSTTTGKRAVYNQLYICRKQMKETDLWTRYFEPNTYRSINGPLPIEWETEVFEKFEKPYKKEGHGLSILELALDSNVTDKKALKKMILPSIDGLQVYKADSVTKNLNTYDHFFLANRLFLLNLAAIYTTGFECPNNDSVIPELNCMVDEVRGMYDAYNTSFPQYPVKGDYLELYAKLKAFVYSQPKKINQFDHYTFIRDYINPLFALNQQYIREYKVVSSNLNDYSLNNNAISIFDKTLYTGQNTLGIYSGITDEKTLAKIREVGKLLFFDPILSGNNERSCASCHKPAECFTDTAASSAMNFEMTKRLPRNTPSLVNVVYNHLVMLDGKHISLQNQAKGVITNPDEMGGAQDDVVKKILSCKEYKDAFEALKKYTYKNKEVCFDHVISAVTFYIGSFSNFTAPFDDAMNAKKDISQQCKNGFNLFMGKAQCGTCHYIPEFNGVRPPYIESEFEVIGVPVDKNYSALSTDSGRADIYFSDEMMNAFRTNTVRNSSYTKPYMHNGIFNTMQEVLDFYNAGGGAGKGLKVKNQTLNPQQLHLTNNEMADLLTFIKSLDEDVPVELPPAHLPLSSDKKLNDRTIGGIY